MRFTLSSADPAIDAVTMTSEALPRVGDHIEVSEGRTLVTAVMWLEDLTELGTLRPIVATQGLD
jgi:hypothetical protein